MKWVLVGAITPLVIAPNTWANMSLSKSPLPGFEWV
jgi:hypothetical protein